MRRRLRVTGMLALPFAIAVAVAGLPLSSSALSSSALATPTPTATATGSGVPVTAPPLPPGASLKRVCSWPPPAGHAACQAMALKPAADDAGPRQEPDNCPAFACYGPADLQAAYKLTSASALDGKGRTVAIIDAWDDPNAASDLAVYRSTYGLPPCTVANGCFRKVNQSGGTQLPSPDITGEWEVEETLDIDMVSAICPNCHILLVEAYSDSFQDLAQAARWANSCYSTAACGKEPKSPARFESNSYGLNDSPNDAAANPYYEGKDSVVTAAAGDTGFFPIYPATSPYVVAVGGTSLLPASNARGYAEIAWYDGGSGCSYQPKPPWQHDSGCATRTVTDVAADADPNTGPWIYDTYPAYDAGLLPGWNVIGGTSASSPIIASVYALAGLPASDGTPAAYAVYAHAKDLFDIVSGTNYPAGCSPTYLCTAVPGYDGPTGNGTPDGIGGFVATPGHPKI
jgi:hypothetical protein